MKEDTPQQPANSRKVLCKLQYGKGTPAETVFVKPSPPQSISKGKDPALHSGITTIAFQNVLYNSR